MPRDTHSVRDYAKNLHAGQIYYPDRPYIEHLDRVASHFAPDSHEYKVAYLHDAVEDGHCTVMDIRVLWGNNVAQHVAAITRTHESYDYYIRNLLKHDIARRVKLADLADNLAGCFVHISNNDKSRNWQNLAARYAKAIRILTS
jgi:(p)ppGpp synthase/HD superfamily hydrolase